MEEWDCFVQLLSPDHMNSSIVSLEDYFFQNKAGCWLDFVGENMFTKCFNRNYE